MAQLVTVTKGNGIATLLLNRPEAFNALDRDLLACFASNMLSLATDQNVRGIIISGEGKAFCAGGDLRWVLACPQGPASGLYELVALFHQAVLEIRRMPKPVIAAINGVAAGGGFSLALGCDFRVMAESAMLRQAYSSSGLCIDGGGSFFLPRLVGLARAMEIMAFDRPISSEQALTWGMVTRVAPQGKVLEEATNMAQEIARGSLNSFAWSKKLLTDSFDTAFERHIEQERTGMCACAAHPEGIEGLRAFAEKRKPVFTS
jgi:2-(1,2-epoxy-1,2-dihydrophenyl)acetyl-CoA isomerase